MEKQRKYRGCNICRTGWNPCGLRWEAYVDGFGFVRADTLEGVKHLIRHYQSAGRS